MMVGDFSQALDSPLPSGGYQQQKASSSYNFSNGNEYRTPTSSNISDGTTSGYSTSNAAASTTSSSSTTTATTSGQAEEEAWRKEFQTIDSDRNGFITLDELKNVIPKFVPVTSIAGAFKLLIGLVDKDRDGKIDFDEYKQFRSVVASLMGSVAK
jgi:hypothetical protein